MKILNEIRELREEVRRMADAAEPAMLAARSTGEAAAHAAGLLSYEDLQDRLTIGRKTPRKPCMRRVKQIVARHRKVVRPVKVGGCSVGFREANVERLLEHLEGGE